MNMMREVRFADENLLQCCFVAALEPALACISIIQHSGSSQHMNILEKQLESRTAIQLDSETVGQVPANTGSFTPTPTPTAVPSGIRGRGGKWAAACL